MTNEFKVLQEAQESLRRAVWAGCLEHPYPDFDDHATRDKFVTEKVGETLKILDVYIRKTRPVQNSRHRSKPTKTLFS